MTKSLRILIVEDSEDDYLLLKREFDRSDYDIEFQHVDSAAKMKEALESNQWDAVLSDYSMGGFNGLAALGILKDTGLDIPFILVTGSIGEDRAVEIMKAGAHDFITKGHFGRLMPAIERELGEAEVRNKRREAEEALRQSEEYFRSLIENSSDIITVLDQAEVLRFVSPSAERILGYRPDELLFHNVLRFIHPDDVSHVHKSFEERIRNPPCLKTTEFRFRHKDGHWLYLESIGKARYSPTGELSVIVNARDITERRKSEDEIRRQLDRLAALQTIDMAITSSLDLRVTLDVILSQITAQLHVDAATILLMNNYTQTLDHAGTLGFHTDALRYSHVRIGEGFAGQAASSRQPIAIDDLREQSGAFPRSQSLAAEGFVFYYAVPLIAKGQVKGVIELFRRERHEIDHDWREFMQALADQAAIAVENSALFEDLQRSNASLTHAYDTTLEGWSRALDIRDKETEGHTQRVTDLTHRLGRAFGLNDAELGNVRRGSLLHDVGKLGIPDGILLKPGPLTEDEWAVMRRHTDYAFELLSPIEFLRPSLDIPYCHHERWDGSGYPRGLRGEQIPLSARIFMVADVWDALRSNRPYREAWPEEKVREYIRSLAGVKFDPKVVEVFLAMDS